LLQRIAFHKTYKFLLVIFCLFLSIVIGVIRYLTGPELAFSLFYLFAIALVTWCVGRWSGVLVSIVSALSWLAADLRMCDSFSSIFIPYVNESFRLIVFLIATFMIDRLKSALDNHKELARTDPLTGIANRRAFFDLVNLELNKARRYQSPITVIYLDIDNFKRVNDHQGHHIGDRLLRSTAKTLTDNIRAIDLIARLGGDEFCILLAETDAHSAELVVRKLKGKLLELAHNRNWPVTFSFGVVTYKDLPDRVEAMINAADSQMYIAKQKGKNRIQYQVVAGRHAGHNSLEAA
jgi:diguanylate cyclase (GGDEF)-like protein